MMLYTMISVTLATGGRPELAIDCFFILLYFLSLSNFAAVAAKAIIDPNVCYVCMYVLQKLL